MSLKKCLSNFLVWVALSWPLVIFTRAVETIALYQHHFVFHLIKNECIGLSIDLLLVGAFVAFLFPFYYLFSLVSAKAANIFVGAVLGTAVVAHLFIIQYFAYCFLPLGGLLPAHTIEEVLFTVSTVENNYVFFGITLILALILELVLWILLKRLVIGKRFSYFLILFSLSAIVSTFFIHVFFSRIDADTQPYSIRINKSYFFYRNLLSVFHAQHTPHTFPVNLEERKLLFPERDFLSNDFPLLSATGYRDVLGSFFAPVDDEQLPNIVIIIVEGLGARFLPDFHGIKLMPFLDSLTHESLYWDKALTVGERSYSVVPAILASSPYGKKGFTFESENLLSLSLVNILNKFGYYSTFFYGQPSWFHNKGPYLYRNGLDKFVDCSQFPEQYSRIMVGDYFWGYHDQDLFHYALQFIRDSLPEFPRLDIYFTGSMHSPFAVCNKELYDERLTDLIKQAGLSSSEKRFFQKYWKYIRTTLFSDDALRNLFAGYQQLPSYSNTIFIITGDHPMNEIPIESRYHRYRVPIIVYSPALTHPQTFHSVNSHLDIPPTLLAFLHQRYFIEIPKQQAFIGKIMDTAVVFRNIQPVVFMNGERFIMDIYSDRYFLSSEKFLFRILENDNLELVNNESIKEMMCRMLQNFKSLNTYCCENNRLVPDTVYYGWFKQ